MLRRSGPGGLLGVVVATLAPLVLLAASASAAGSQLDLRGVWNAPASANGTSFPQKWHITSEDLASGALSGTDVAPSGTAFSLDGTISGSSLTLTISGGSYTSHVQGTVSGSGLSLAASGTFKDSNGTRGTVNATRLSAPPGSVAPGTVPPSTTPAPPQDQVCVPDCSQGADVAYPPSLLPGQTSEVVSTGCGASARTTASARAGKETLCGLIDDVAAMAGAVGDAPGSAAASMLKGLGQILTDLGSTPGQGALSPLEQSGTLPPGTLQNILNQVLQSMPNSTTPADASTLQNADDTLAPDFPSGDRSVASAGLQLAASPMPSPALVIQSIVAEHPSPAAASAFGAAVKLATASSRSPARGEARMTLLFAFALGRRALDADLPHPGSQVSLASAAAKVAFHRRTRLTVAATPLGARVLRLLEVLGLGHRVSVELVISSAFNGKTSRATRTLSVR